MSVIPSRYIEVHADVGDVSLFENGVSAKSAPRHLPMWFINIIHRTKLYLWISHQRMRSALGCLANVFTNEIHHCMHKPAKPIIREDTPQISDVVHTFGSGKGCALVVTCHPFRPWKMRTTILLLVYCVRYHSSFKLHLSYCNGP